MSLPPSFPAFLVMRGGQLVPGEPAPGAAGAEAPPPARCASAEELERAAGDAVWVQRKEDALVLVARLDGRPHRLAVVAGEAVYRGPQVRAYWKVDGWVLTSTEPVGELAEGERVDLGPCARLMALAVREVRG